MRSLVVLLAAGVGLAAAAAFAQAPASAPGAPASAPGVRDGLEALEARLDRAVDRVSLPHAARLLGRAEAARAYRLPGYGVVLVLTPRALPGESGRVYQLRTRAPKARREVHVETHAPGAPPAVWVGVEDEEEGVETFERQVLVLQHETEAARRAQEEQMERIVSEMRVRIAPPARVPGAPPVPEPAEAPEAPTPAAAPLPPAAPRAPEAPAPPGAPAPPAPPPWKFWFEAGAPQETRSPAAVIADVRSSLVEALVAPGDLALGLSGDERISVAVDFVPGGLFAANARPGRTLVVSVRARDVNARTRGAISPEELRRRVDVSEY